MNNTENIIIRKYEKEDLPDLIRIWNPVVEDGVAFPQEECLVQNFSHSRLTQLGTIPGGFRMKDGTFEDICPYYHVL